MRALVAAVVAIALTAAAPARAQTDPYVRAASPNPAVRSLAAADLAIDPQQRAVDMLIVLLQRDVDWTVRLSAARAIERRRDPALGDALKLASRFDPSPDVRRGAAEAYEHLWPFSKSPKGAAGYSLLCPGCGHFYLRQNGTGAAYLLTTAALLGSGLALISQSDDVSALGGASDTAKVPIGLQLVMAGQNLWFYAIFDAYRDARVLRGDEGYEHPITRETLGTLASAPFRPSVLKSPWVWAGVPAALAAGIAVSYAVAPDELTGDDRPSIFEVDEVNFLGKGYSPGAGFALGELYFGGLFVPVGVGEEALFRGVLQAELTERFGPWGGLAIASTIFGAVHTFNFTQKGSDIEDAAVAVPFITIVGSSLGLAYMNTGYRLETSVAMHFWYDFLLSTAAFAADPEHQPFVVRYGMTL